MTDTSTRPEGLSAYIAVTAAYWAFMMTDGALRMLVLLQFHTMGFSPVQLAYLFVLYEITGMVTNLCAGWIAARFGLTSTLYAGLGIQVLALLALAQLDPTWAIGVSVAYVMVVQGASGVAKDLAKMSSKSAVTLLAPSEDGRAAGDARFCLGCTGDGSNPRCHSDCRVDCDAVGSAEGSNWGEVLGGLFEIGERELALIGTCVSVRSAGRLVRRWDPDLLLCGAVRRIRFR